MSDEAIPTNKIDWLEMEFKKSETVRRVNFTSTTTEALLLKSRYGETSVRYRGSPSAKGFIDHGRNMVVDFSPRTPPDRSTLYTILSLQTLIRRSAGSIITNVDWDRCSRSDHFGNGNDHFQLESQLTMLSRVCGDTMHLKWTVPCALCRRLRGSLQIRCALSAGCYPQLFAVAAIAAEKTRDNGLLPR